MLVQLLSNGNDGRDAALALVAATKEKHAIQMAVEHPANQRVPKRCRLRLLLQSFAGWRLDKCGKYGAKKLRFGQLHAWCPTLSRKESAEQSSRPRPRSVEYGTVMAGAMSGLLNGSCPRPFAFALSSARLSAVQK